MREQCENCGRFLGSYEGELKNNYKGFAKGETINLYGCKFCEDFIEDF